MSWQGMAMVLLLKTYLGLDYRKMASHLKARRELVVRLGFKRAPSKSQIHRCMELFPERWIKQFNEMVLEEFKKKIEEHRARIPVWTVPVCRSTTVVPI